MQSLLNKIPFIRIFFPFALGVIISLLFTINRDFLIILVSSYFSILACYFVLNVSKRKSVKFVFGLLLNFFLFFVAVESCYLHKADNNPNHYTNVIFTKETLLSGHICDIPQLKEKSIKAKIQLTHYKENNVWKSCEGNFYAYFPCTTADIVTGSNIVFKNKLTAIPEPKNPFDFNYKQYLYYKNIYHQCFLKENDFKIAHSGFELPITEYPLLLKSRLLEILKENKLKDDDLSVTSALLLGYDDEISRDLMGAYSRTGTLHVLSVSGLHVGILFMMLNFIIRLPNRKLFVVIKTLLIFICIWFYAALTGMSPSVVRSATMFSFILIGTAINKKGNIYNTLLASAFLILLFDPFLLIDVGFQLSYLAVGGIVFFYPYVSNWFVSRHKFANVIWRTTAVSISAQIITLPITIYYFGQFPTLFFIANLVVIPLSYVVMVGSMILVCVSKIKFLAIVFSTLVGWSVTFMNEITLFLDRFKFVNLSEMNVSFYEMMILSLLIGTITYFFINKNYFSGITSLVLSVFLLLSSILNSFFVKESKTIIFHATNSSVIDTYIDKSATSFSFYKEQSNQFFSSAAKNRMRNAIKHIKENKLQTGLYYFENTGQKFGVLCGDTLLNYELKHIELDYLVLSNNAYVKGIDKLKVKTIVADGSNSYKTINYLKKKQLTNLWITKEQGAFIVNE